MSKRTRDLIKEDIEDNKETYDALGRAEPEDEESQ